MKASQFAFRKFHLADTPQFRGGNPYFFSENLYQSVSFIYASRKRSRDSYPDAVCKKSRHCVIEIDSQQQRTKIGALLHVARQSNKAVRQSPDLLFIATSFWFEESPSAVRTNTAGLGRLCTLFVWSTLLVFEHTHDVLSSMLVLCCTMVTTSTAAMSNSRYADTDRMKNVFLIRFSKPHFDRTKAGR